MSPGQNIIEELEALLTSVCLVWLHISPGWGVKYNPVIIDKEFGLIMLWKKLQISGRIACSAAQINYPVRDPEIKLILFFTAVNNEMFMNIF